MPAITIRAIHPLLDGLTFALFGTSRFARVRARASLLFFFFSDIWIGSIPKKASICASISAYFVDSCRVAAGRCRPAHETPEIWYNPDYLKTNEID
jgi:hypothetical protein